MSTDSFVVQPLFFPGGSIGELAVNGTVNDLAVSGAEPKFLSASFILEEGFPLAQLAAIVDAMADAAATAGVQIVTGDTKVVERGHGDGCYINTAGVGVLRPGINVGPHRAQAGDAVLVSGTIGDHGMAIMSVREGLEFESQIRSDCAALNGMIADVLDAVGSGVHAMRDPTRGGLASTLNEIATASDVGIEIDEASLPVRTEVQSACELLGLDPVYVANEGKAVFFVAPEAADRALDVLRAHPLGRDAARIGHVTAQHPKHAGGAHRDGREPRDSLHRSASSCRASAEQPPLSVSSDTACPLLVECSVPTWQMGFQVYLLCVADQASFSKDRWIRSGIALGSRS